MKKFFNWKWRSIPVGVAIAVLLVALVAGSAFAAYNFWNAAAEVTVDEAITVTPPITAPGPNDGTWDKGLTTWTISLYPGESGSSYFNFHNVSSADITVTPSVVLSNWPAGGNDGEVTCTFNGSSYLVPGGGNCPFTITVSAGTSTVPGSYTFDLTVSR